MTSLDGLEPVVGTAVPVLVRPGDTLVVCLDRSLDMAEIDDMRTQLAAVLPEGVKVAIFDVGIELGVLRPDVSA